MNGLAVSRPGTGPWARAALVALALCLTVGLGYVLPLNSSVRLGALAAAAAGAVAAAGFYLRSGFTVLPLLVFCAALTPVQAGAGMSAGAINACVVLAAFLCAEALAWGVIFRRPAGFTWSRPVVATLVFMAVAVAAFAAGQYPWFPAPPAPMRAQVGGLGLFLISGGLFLVVGHQVKSLAQLRRLTWIFIGAGAIALLTSALPIPPVSIRSFLITDAQSIGSLFWVWFVAISVSQAFFNRELSDRRRVALLALGVLALARGFALAFTWVSGWLPPLVALGVIAFLRFPRATFAGMLLAIAPALAFGSPVFEAWMTAENYSSSTRGEAMKIVLDMLKTNPWLGFGPSNYYHYTLLFPIYGWWVRFNSHNNYLDLLAQTGIVGLLAFLWVTLEVFLLALRLYRRRPTGFARAYVVGALGGLAGSLVAGGLADWIVPFAYNIGFRGFRSSLLFWVFLGGLLALERMSRASRAGQYEPVLAADAAGEPRAGTRRQTGETW